MEFNEQEMEGGSFPQERGHENKTIWNVLKILCFIVPLMILFFFLYINFLPFGFDKTYKIGVFEDGEVYSSSSKVYLTDSYGQKIENINNIYESELISLVVRSGIALKEVNVSVFLYGNDAYFTQVDFDKEKVDWDYLWDFSERIPKELKGNAEYNPERDCAYFDGQNNETLYYPNSSEIFENGSFIVYVEWLPQDVEGRNQQIIGHYNWELWQNNDSVEFMAGRLGDDFGEMPSIQYKINSTQEFFGKKHSALAIYRAGSKSVNGYLELYIDGYFAGRKSVGEKTIYRDYNLDENLSFGWSPHNYRNNSFYTGCIYSAGFDYSEIKHTNELNFINDYSYIKIPIIVSGRIESIEINLKK